MGEKNMELLNLTYVLEGEGYVILNNGIPFIVQDRYIPYPAETIEESAKKHIECVIKDYAKRDQEIISIEKLQEQLTETQLALVEQFEVNLVLQEEVTNTQLALAEIFESVVNANG